MQNKNYFFGLFLIGLVFLIGAGCKTKEETNYNNKNMIIDDTDLKAKAMALEQASTGQIKGSYQEYDQSKLVLAEKGKVVLFFHASWCPTCRAIEEDVRKSNIPDGVTILKVDYDSAGELKKKYGVTVQHTFVQVDKDGTAIKKWMSGSGLTDILREIE